MKTLDFYLNSEKNGGKISAFHYSHGLNELVGSWSASIAGGSFKAGNSISFDNVMQNGIITRAYKDSEGLWHLEGKDAGIKLMKSTPLISDLPTGNAKTVLASLADTCDIPLVMSANGLSDFNVRSLISGSTCAEAVLELAMFSGFIAYIDNKGRLIIASPSNQSPHFSNVLDDSGSDIDLDGYATHVLLTLNRRQSETSEQNIFDDDDEIVYIGETPSINPHTSSVSGSFDKCSYSLKSLEPFGVLKELSSSFYDNGLTITTHEVHEYEYRHKIIWRDNQEYVLFAFLESGYTLTRTAEGSLEGSFSFEYDDNGGHHQVYISNPSFSETTTEIMTRHLSNSYAVIGIPDDWADSLNFVDEENITRSTVRDGFITPQDNMPSYSPPFDSRISRKFSSSDNGKRIVCLETQENYEVRQIGSIAPVTLNGQNIPHFLQGSNLAIQTHSTPQWVLVKKSATIFEQFDNDGKCILSTKSEYSDDGSKWLNDFVADNGNNYGLDAYQAAYAAFSQISNGLQVSTSSAGLSSQWQFLELQGRTKSTVSNSDKANAALANIDYWYDNGQYVRQSVCPHYNTSAKSCNVYLLNNPSSSACSKFQGLNWGYCDRALAALSLARAQDKPQVEAPVFGSASSGANSSAVGYQRDIYIDDTLDTNTAQTIADNIASNILAVKGSKGLRKTVTIPYNENFLPDGSIVEVTHDWANLQTSVTYRDAGDIPECLISQSVASIAAFVATRENSRSNIPQYGIISEINNDKITVTIGNSNFTCSSKLKNLALNDIVLVSFPAGNKLRGQVIARL